MELLLGIVLCAVLAFCCGGILVNGLWRCAMRALADCGDEFIVEQVKKYKKQGSP